MGNFISKTGTVDVVHSCPGINKTCTIIFNKNDAVKSLGGVKRQEFSGNPDIAGPGV